MLDKIKALMDMQKKMQELKQQLESTDFTVESPDGSVAVTMNGSQELREVKIRGNFGEDGSGLLESAIKDTFNRAIRRSHDITAEKMKNITGLNLPGLM